MDDAATSLDAAWRTPALFFAFAALAMWEALAPRRLTVRATIVARWRVNISLFLINATLLNLLLPGLAVAAAAFAVDRGLGVFAWVQAPYALAFVLTFLILDLVRYTTHWVMHRVPLLWRLHRSHHSDPEYDITTGFRFHPVEAAFHTVAGILAVLLLGGPVLAVLASELWATIAALFTHANARIPIALDKRLRRVLVTPDLHRVHHSIRYEESASNLGNSLVFWDKLFGTYREQPADGHEAMEIGHPAYRTPESVALGRVLIDPIAAARSIASSPP